MGSVVHPPPQATAVEYRLTLLDDLRPTIPELRRAIFGTAGIHLIAILLLLAIPGDVVETRPERAPLRHMTRLVDPPTRLTQRAPNRAPLSPEISVGAVVAAPKLVPPSQPVPRQRFAAPMPTLGARRTPRPAVPQEPPKMIARNPQPIQIAPLPTAVAPPPPAAQPPKLALENVPPASAPGQGTGRIKVPGSGIEEAVREVAKTGALARSVGDDTEALATLTPSPNPTPSPSRPKSRLELMSDPQGVDFRPYLLQVLQSVRRNWFAIMPESARLGQRGRVVVQFAIAPGGQILKVVLTTESGAHAFDRAAVAALSASNPLPQLPSEFKGDRVVLQFTFLYNAPR